MRWDADWAAELAAAWLRASAREVNWVVSWPAFASLIGRFHGSAQVSTLGLTFWILRYHEWSLLQY
jgi:hypothetical protein